MAKKNKPTVVKDGVDFDKYRSISAKEVEVTNNSIEETDYEKNENPNNSFDYNARQKNQKR